MQMQIGPSPEGVPAAVRPSQYAAAGPHQGGWVGPGCACVDAEVAIRASMSVGMNRS